MVSTKQQILDIAMNLNRIGNWAADGYDAKQARIVVFLNQTNTYIHALQNAPIPDSLSRTMQAFLPVFQEIYTEGLSKPQKTDVWAEKIMTWGNILTHRASLIS